MAEVPIGMRSFYPSASRRADPVSSARWGDRLPEGGLRGTSEFAAISHAASQS